MKESIDNLRDELDDIEYFLDAIQDVKNTVHDKEIKDECDYILCGEYQDRKEMLQEMIADLETLEDEELEIQYWKEAL